ncbi:hypothetical protein J6TS7_29220 [Paenibacillus dendritiformis]|uniref:tyrosine-type recombinase/integrase n=1 Tax=Paenibacillus TaxID=44249 RepID=UPI001B1E53D7|nr:tyrosine-type recombinase/integrase [Paenibacillus dendritiformis]GIO79312.1 hypothetical protein J6TS7_29220 [Paenibacillus dendritiformis]
MGIIEKYEEWLKVNGNSKNTISRYLQVANQFMEWHTNLLKTSVFDPTEVSALDLQQWKTYLLTEATYQRGGRPPQRYSVSSINNSIKAIRKFFDALEELGITKNQARKLKPQKTARNFETEPRWLTRSERNKLVRCIEDEQLENKNRWKFTRNRAIIYVQLHAGLRRSEVVDLQIGDLDFESGYIFVRDGKGGKARRVELNKELRNALKEWMSERGDVNTKKLFVSTRGGDGITSSAVNYIYQTLREKTGISDLTTHSPRHTMAHDLIEAGYSIQRVADILGHENINYTRIYTLSNSEERREALESLSSI